LNAWKMNPISRFRTRARSMSLKPDTARPFSEYVPSVAVSRSPRIERSVVLPQPDGPAIER